MDKRKKAALISIIGILIIAVIVAVCLIVNAGRSKESVQPQVPETQVAETDLTGTEEAQTEFAGTEAQTEFAGTEAQTEFAGTEVAQTEVAQTENEPERNAYDSGDAATSEKNDDAKQGIEAGADTGVKQGEGTAADNDEKQGKETSSDAEPKDDQKDKTAGADSAGKKQTKDKAGTKKSSTVSVASGPLHVEGTHLADAAGNTVQLRGVSTHGLAWFPAFVNANLFCELADEWGANVVRLAMYTEEYGGYCSGGDKNALKKLVKDGVEYAADAGLYCIVDWHILSDGSPVTHQDEAIKFFDEMSAEFAGYDNVIYEICNEPNGGTNWKTIKGYAEKVIPVIRKNAPDAIIIVGTPTWSQDVLDAAADPITGYDNIMYALHFYAGTHKDSLRNNMVSAIKKGLPIFVTEFGITDASGNGNVDEASANKWIDVLDDNAVSYVCWNLANKDESSSLFKASCSKTHGFTDADMSAEGLWLRNILAERAGAKPKKNKKGADGTDSKDKKDTEKTKEDNTDKDSTEKPDDSGKTSMSDVDKSGKTGSILWKLVSTNSWSEGGAACYQYSLELTNEGKACDGWSVSIEFDSDITVTNSWNGKFETSGKVLTISNADYNGSLAAGASASDVGFIVKMK